MVVLVVVVALGSAVVVVAFGSGVVVGITNGCIATLFHPSSVLKYA